MSEEIGSIRHPAVIQLMQEKVEIIEEVGTVAHPRSSIGMQDEWMRVSAINAAGKTRLRQWMPLYDTLKDTKRAKIKKAVEIALRNVHPPFE